MTAKCNNYLADWMHVMMIYIKVIGKSKFMYIRFSHTVCKLTYASVSECVFFEMHRGGD